MSAETLRKAAALMRERATAVPSGAQWTGSHYWIEDYDPSDPSGGTSMQRLIGGMDGPDCDHYASWHPAVALAVAALLEEVARLWESSGNPDNELGISPLGRYALPLATAYLGSDQ